MKQIVSSNNAAFHQYSNFLNRPRLHKILKDAMDYPLVIVCAGAGYGKTYAIYSFLQEYYANAIWIKLNEHTNTPAYFWENYAHAVSLTCPDAGERLLKIGFPETDEAFAKYSTVLKEAYVLPEKHVLVCDDFHMLHNPAILHFFERTANLISQSLVMILISRTTPNFNLIRMIMDESVLTINEDTLNFTENEINEYFKQLNLQINRADTNNILEETHGWPFAVNLIGRSLIKESKYDRHIIEAMKINIFKFIESEVYPAISEKLLRLLLRISLTDHFAANLINTLAKDNALIKEMEQLDTYIRYDFHLDAYIIHHLFLDYLQQNQHILTVEEKYETYQKAAEWCEANNYQVDALSYYEKSKDYSAIMQIVYSFDLHTPQNISKHGSEIFDRMPEDVKLKNPMFPAMNLKLKMSLGLLTESSILAEQYVLEYKSHPESPAKYHALSGIYGAWGVLRLMMSPYTDVYDFDIYFKQQRAYYDKDPHASFAPLASQSVDTYSLLIGTNRAGAPEEYIKAIERSIPHVSHVSKGSLCGLDDLARGQLFFLQRKMDDSEKNLKQALDKARIYKQYNIQRYALFYLMAIAFFRGDLNATNTILQTTKDLLHEKNYILRYVAYDIASSYYYLVLDQLEQVPNWIKDDFSPYVHPAFLENCANRVKAHYHYQAKQYNTLLAFIENEWDKQAILLNKIVLKILAALSLYQLKRRKEALSALTESYQLSAPNNIIIPFIQHAKDMRTLTAFALRNEACTIPKPWLEDINRKASAFAKKKSHMISEYKATNNLEEEVPLTKRERDILKDLSLGLSRSEIAANQNISINTVKMAISIIYEKLHANNLADAIRIAFERKML